MKYSCVKKLSMFGVGRKNMISEAITSELIELFYVSPETGV